MQARERTEEFDPCGRCGARDAIMRIAGVSLCAFCDARGSSPRRLTDGAPSNAATIPTAPPIDRRLTVACLDFGHAEPVPA